MDEARKQVLVTCAGVAVMAAVVWLIAFGGHLKLSAQLGAAAGAGDDPPVTFGRPLTTGTIADKWQPHVPRGAHLGKHRMYRHPAECSPGMTEAMTQAWRFTPPSEGDL